MNKHDNLAVIILAAGLGSRLKNQVKQLIQYEKESFLKNAVRKALQISSHVYVVLGYEKELCQQELKEFPVTIVYNSHFKQGIGSSIACGIEHTQKYSNTLIMLVDQPFIPLCHYQALSNYHIDNKITTSIYEEQNSVPAIFPKSYYKKLLNLSGDKGAKAILRNEAVIGIKLENKLAVDIDTNEDIKKYLK